MATLTLVSSPVRGAGMTRELENAARVFLGKRGVFNSGDPLAAPQHATLATDGDGDVVVIDLGTANGTFVNGVKVKGAPIADRDRIVVGESVFEVRTAYPRRCPTCRTAVPRERVVLRPARARVEWPSGFLAYSCPACYAIAIPRERGGGRVEVDGSVVLRVLEHLQRAAEDGRLDEERWTMGVEPVVALGAPEARKILDAAEGRV